MFDQPKPPTGTYLFSLLIIVFGGWVSTHAGWGGVGGIIIGIALLLDLLVSVVAVLREYRQVLYEESQRLEAETKLMEVASKLSEEDKNFVRRDYRIRLAKRQEYEKRKHD